MKTRYVRKGQLWVPENRGLGDTIASWTKRLGIKPCGGCTRRAQKLNKWFPNNRRKPAYPIAGGSSNYFNWGYEATSGIGGPQGCSFNVWRNHSGQSTTEFHSGAKSLFTGPIENVQPNAGNDSEGVDCDWTAGSIPYSEWQNGTYYRTWLKFGTNFVWTNGNHDDTKPNARVKAYRQHPTNAHSPFGTTVTDPGGYTGYFRSDGFGVHECANTNSGCRDTSDALDAGDSHIVAQFNMNTLIDGQWHEYIFWVKPNSDVTVKDAQFKVWIDGGTFAGDLSHYNGAGNANTTYTGWRLYSRDEEHGNIDPATPDAVTPDWGGWMGIVQYWQLNELGPAFPDNTAGCTGGITPCVFVDDVSMDSVFSSAFSQTSSLTVPSYSYGNNPSKVSYRIF